MDVRTYIHTYLCVVCLHVNAIHVHVFIDSVILQNMPFQLVHGGKVNGRMKK